MTPDQQDRLLDRLVEIAPPILDRYYTPDRCVNATRECIDILAYFGIDAKPQKTQVLAGNPAWSAWMQQTGGEGKMPDAAWSVGIDLRPKDEPNRYPGHLVARVDDKLVDLALGQFSRPQHGMELPGAGVFQLAEPSVSPEYPDFEGGFYTVGPTTVCYRLLPEKDWRFRSASRGAGEIIRLLKPEFALTPA